MRFPILVTSLIAGVVLFSNPAGAQCGGAFPDFLGGIKAEAIRKGHAAATVDQFLLRARQDPAVIAADRKQGVYQLDLTSFSKRLVTLKRLQQGQSHSRRQDAVFRAAEQTYGVPRGVLLAFWAFETDYGNFQAISTR